jgi:hypothetical protein
LQASNGVSAGHRDKLSMVQASVLSAIAALPVFGECSMAQLKIA